MSEAARVAVLKATHASFKAGEESGLVKGLDGLLVPGVPTKDKAATNATSRLAKSHSSSTVVREVQKLAHTVSTRPHPTMPSQREPIDARLM